jgi:hypothetical protein
MKISLCVVMTLGLSSCNRSASTQIGSLNEPGIPNEFLAKLESRVKGEINDVKSQQALEGIKVGIDNQHHSFFVTNDSDYFLDQLSFACDVGHKQFVYFTWDVGVIGSYPEDEIQWVIPKTQRRLFPAEINTEKVALLHTANTANETLRSSQVNWLLQKYSFHDCVPLDIADGRQEDPRVLSGPPPDKLRQDDAFGRVHACNGADMFVAMCTRRNIRSPDTSAEHFGGYEVPLPEFPANAYVVNGEPETGQTCGVATQWQNYCRATSR